MSLGHIKENAVVLTLKPPLLQVCVPLSLGVHRDWLQNLLWITKFRGVEVLWSPLYICRLYIQGFSQAWGVNIMHNPWLAESADVEPIDMERLII